MKSVIHNILFCLVYVATIAASKKKILSFGGNGMIGSEVMHKMVEAGDYDVTLGKQDEPVRVFCPSLC